MKEENNIKIIYCKECKYNLDDDLIEGNYCLLLKVFGLFYCSAGEERDQS